MTTNLNGTFAAVQAASRELALLSDDTINQILNAVADAAIAETPFILSENEKDLARMDKSNPKYDRLKLTEERLKGIAADTRNVATLPSPLGRILKETSRPNGMKLTKVSCATYIKLSNAGCFAQSTSSTTKVVVGDS